MCDLKTGTFSCTFSSDVTPSSPNVKISVIDDKKKISPAVSLHEQPESLFGLAEKYVAVESVIYLSDQIRGLKSSILDYLPQGKRVIFEEYESQVDRDI